MSEETAAAYTKENLMSHCTETSAKTGVNIEETFIRAAKMLYLKHKNEWGEINGAKKAPVMGQKLTPGGDRERTASKQ